MAAELIKLKLTHISLVKSPANGEKLMLKSGEPVLTFELQKFSDEKQIAYGIVYAPNVVDSQGDWATAETIEQASDDFMQQGLTKNVDMNHDFKNSGAFVAQSWIVKQNDPLFADKVGAWAVGIKVPNAAMWIDVKAGKYTGLSLAGSAGRVQKSDDETEQGFFEKLNKWWNTKNEQQDIDEMTDDDLGKILKGVGGVVDDKIKPLTDRIEALEKQAKPPETNISAPLTEEKVKEIFKSMQNDAGEINTLSDKEIEKLVKNIAADYFQKGKAEGGSGQQPQDANYYAGKIDALIKSSGMTYAQASAQVLKDVGHG